MDSFFIRPLSEGDIDGIVAAAGGGRAHPDADRRTAPGADYLLGDALIELKALDDEGLEKPERQEKLAALFGQVGEGRPVVVVDRSALAPEGRRAYDRILEGPVKTAAAKARKQLRQSRKEHSAATASVFLLVNNGYTALDHEALCAMVAHRARNDSSEIDGVVVAGIYYYSDGFESYFVCPMEYLPINADRPFRSYDVLHAAWNGFVERFMTDVVTSTTRLDAGKAPVVDTQFDVDGVTFIKPAPPMGLPSGFFGNGRPRRNQGRRIPPVARTFPDMTDEEWGRFRGSLDDPLASGRDFAFWQRERAGAAAITSPLLPLVPVPVTRDGWTAWCDQAGTAKSLSSICEYATQRFQEEIRALGMSARRRSECSILPSRYVLAMTEEIGQDCENDVSHIAIVRETVPGEIVVHDLVTNARIPHERALALACAYAIAEGCDCVLWEKDLAYAWV